MSRIVVMNHVTLDGVMQAPGRADEDTRGGFTHGGWGSAADEAVGKAMSERMAAGGGLEGWLFGRRTYQDLLGYWNQLGQRQDDDHGRGDRDLPDGRTDGGDDHIGPAHRPAIARPLPTLRHNVVKLRSRWVQIEGGAG